MIVWHDDRDGNFNIYAARSTESFGCGQKTCELKMMEEFPNAIDNCNISLYYTPVESGYYNFVLYFYSDSGLEVLYKSISIEGNEEKWYINDDPIEDNLSYNGTDLLGVNLVANETVTISYVPDKNDRIFDIILYVKLVGILSEGE